MKKLLTILLTVLLTITIGTVNVLGEVNDDDIITIDIDGEEKNFRIVGEVDGYAKVMSMFDITKSTYWDNNKVKKTTFSDGIESVKYAESNVDTILEEWYQSLKNKNISLYRAIEPQDIYQYDAKWSSDATGGYLTTWLDPTGNFDENTHSGTAQYILFSSEESLDTFSKTTESFNRHVYLPCIKDIFEYYGLTEALGANDTNKIFFNQYTKYDENLWLRDADNASGRSEYPWAVVGSVGGIGTIGYTESAGIRAEFVVDLNKIIYKDSNGTTHVPIPEGKTLFYTGGEQCGLYGLNGYIEASNYKKTSVGEYTAEVSLKGGSVWSDGTNESKQISFKIAYPYVGIDVNGNKIIEENEKFRELSSNGNLKTVISMFNINGPTKYNNTSIQTYKDSNVDEALKNWLNKLSSNVQGAIKGKDIYQYKLEWTNEFSNLVGYYTTWMNNSVNADTQELDKNNTYQWLVFSKTSQSVDSIEAVGDSIKRKVYAPSVKDIFDVYGLDMAMGANDVNAMFFGTNTPKNETVWLRDLDCNPNYPNSLWAVVGSVGGIGTNGYDTANNVRAMFTIDLSNIYWTDYTRDYNSGVVEDGIDGNVITGAKNSSNKINNVNLNVISEESAKSILAGGETSNAKAALGNNKEVKIFVEVDDRNDYSKFAIEGVNESNSILLDISLYASIVGDSANKERITNTNGKMITVNIVLTPEQASKIVGENKNYYILRKHDSEPIEKISANMSIDSATGNYIFTFSTDKFSDYAIYSKTKVFPNRPKYLVPPTGVYN